MNIVNLGNVFEVILSCLPSGFRNFPAGWNVLFSKDCYTITVSWRQEIVEYSFSIPVHLFIVELMSFTFKVITENGFVILEIFWWVRLSFVLFLLYY